MPYLISIASAFFGWLVRAATVKAVVMTALLAIVTALASAVVAYAVEYADVVALNSSFGGIASGVWYFLDFFALDVGAPLLIGAHVTRFIIRRIPVIG